MDEIILNGDASPETAPQEKPALHFTRADIITALIMLILGYLCVKLVLAGGQGLGVSIFTLLFCLALLYWCHANQLKLTSDSIVYFALLLLTGAYFALYDNRELKSLALILLPLLTGYFCATVSGIRLEARLGSYLPFDLGDTLLARPLTNIGVGPRILLRGAVFESKNGRNILLLLLGLALAIPVCFVVSSLLQDADAAFSVLWRRLTGSFFSDAIVNILQLIISLPLACYFFAMLYGTRQPRRDTASAQRVAKAARFLPGLLIIGGITPLLLIYIIFFCSQTAYFLNAFSGLLPDGLNYAEYARRGFFELCMVSGINFAAIFVLMFLSKKGSGKGLVYRVYTVALSLFSIALIVISLRKMLLYIQIYGLTPLRLYTSWFMLLLALTFLFVIAKTYLPRFNAAKWTAIATVTMFLLLCFANPDLQIARYNVLGYAEGRLEQLDIDMLGELGAAATPYLLEVAHTEQFGVSAQELAGHILDSRAYLAQRQQDWRAFNLAGRRSAELLQSSTW